MLSGQSWLFFDNAIFVAQVLLAVSFVSWNARWHGSAIFSTGVLFLHLILLSPNTKLVFGSMRGDALWRFVPWSYRPSGMFGLALYDVVLLLFSLFAIGRSLHTGRLRSVLSPLAFFLGALGVGTLSVAFKVYDFDSNRFLIAFRVALLFVVFLSTGLNATNPHNMKWCRGFYVQLLVLYLLGCLSMLMLSSGERWNRYGMATFLPSSAFWIVSYLALIAALFHRMQFGTRFALLLISVFPLWGVSKAVVVYQVCGLMLFAVYTFGRVHLLKLKEHVGLATMLILSLSFAGIVGVVAYSSLVNDSGSLGTRHYQFINLWATLKDGGLARMLFGIGWNQWYRIWVDFPEFDYGAWDAMEVQNDDFRVALQTSLLPVMRGSGIIGLLLFSLSLYSFARRAMPERGPIHVRATRFAMLLVAITTWSSYPELGFDAVAINACFIGYLLRCRQVAWPAEMPCAVVPLFGPQGHRRPPQNGLPHARTISAGRRDDFAN